MEKPFKKRRSIMLMGTKVPIKYAAYLEDENGDELDGSCSYQPLCIFINTSRPNLKKTLLHEATHAVLYLSGVHNFVSTAVEEAIVGAIENGLADYLDI